jgi:hypothetical protein
MAEFWERFLDSAKTDGATKRDRAIEAVGDAAPAEWMAAALLAVESVARRESEFTTDEVWAKIEDAPPPEPRAMGAVMKIAKDKGIVEPTFMTRPSLRRSCNARPLRVWKSRVWRDG